MSLDFKVGDMVMILGVVARVDTSYEEEQPYLVNMLEGSSLTVIDDTACVWVTADTVRQPPASLQIMLKEQKKLETLTKIAALQKELESL